ncbi:MAG: AEC family transporter [Clostridiales bacterium]|nr:AEC family transporter [Clostridiales bacterium]
MNEILFAARTVLPLLALMSCGFLCRRVGLLNETLVKGINQLIFKFLLPVNLFYSIIKTDPSTPISGSLFWQVPLGLVLVFLIAMAFVPRLERDPKKIGVMIQGFGRSNYAFFGIPLVQMLFPGQDTSLAALLVVVTVPVYNVMSVIALSVYCGGEINVKKILLNILKNPLIISTVSGYIVWVLFPDFVYALTHSASDASQALTAGNVLLQIINKTMDDISGISTPLALFTLGGAIQISSIRSHLRQICIAVSGKLIVSPLLFVSIAALLGYRGVALACVLIAFGAPTAVSSFPMAQQMGGDSELAAEQVAFSSICSILTTFLFIFILKFMQLI